MQKVEGSSPFSRFRESPAQAGFFYGLVLSEQAGVVLITHGCGGPLEAAGLPCGYRSDTPGRPVSHLR